MIQRIQTIWLLLATIFGFLYIRMPVYSGTPSAGPGAQVAFTATENLLLFALTAIAALLSLVAIFMFKNRKAQMKFSYLGIVASIALVALEVFLKDNFAKANPTLKIAYSYGALLPIAMVIFLILALSNIRKDEKLIKSLNRLR